jgi:hypothetical protein
LGRFIPVFSLALLPWSGNAVLSLEAIPLSGPTDQMKTEYKYIHVRATGDYATDKANKVNAQFVIAETAAACDRILQQEIDAGYIAGPITDWEYVAR